MPDHYASSWKPKEDLIISFSDQTGDERSQEERDRLFKELREVANRHGFDLSGWGSDEAFRKFYTAPLIKECTAFFITWDAYWLSTIQHIGWTNLGRVERSGRTNPQVYQIRLDIPSSYWV
jgi:hypothetical protein